MSFFANLPTVTVPARKFDTFVDVLTAPDRGSFRIAIRRLNTGTRDVVSSIISPAYPLNTQTAPAYAAAMAFGGSIGRNRSQPQIDAALKLIPRSHPAALEVHAWRNDGPLPAWEAQRERNYTADSNLSALTGATPAVSSPVFTGRNRDLDDSQAPADMPASTESVPFN